MAVAEKSAKEATRQTLSETLSSMSLADDGMLCDDSSMAPVAPLHPEQRSKSALLDEGPQQRSGEILGLLAMLGSAFLFATMALLVKFLKEFGTFELVFWRSLFMFIGTMIMLFAKGIDPVGPPGAKGILIFRGVAGFGFMSAFYYALKTLPISDAIVITYTSPVITGVAAACLLGEKWGGLDALGSCLCLVGVVLISKPSFIMRLLGVTTAPPPLNGVIGALLSALLSSSVYILLRYAKNLSPLVSVNYFALCGIVLGFLFSQLQGEEFVWPEGSAWVLLVGLAVLSISGQFLMNVGLALQTAGKATAMNYVQVVYAYMFQTFIFHSPSDGLSVLGAVLIASWGAISLIKEARKSKEASVAPTQQNDLTQKLLDTK